MFARTVRIVRFVVVVVLVASAVSSPACTHVDADGLTARLAVAREKAAVARNDNAAVIAYADAVAEALNAGVATEDGDVIDALKRLRLAQASTFGEAGEPLACARARLLEASKEQDDADVAWAEAARALPTPQNLDGLFAAAKRRGAQERLRALCAVGPIALPAGDLAGWLERCSGDAGLSRDAASALWTATDRTRLQTGAEPTVSTPLEGCLARCRPALYRSIAACSAADNGCIGVASHAFDVCETNCRDTH